jgi:hypothetical protein
LVIQKGTTDGSFKLRISGNGIEANSLLGADGPSDTYSLKGLHEPCYLGRLNPNWICRYFLPEEIEDYYSETFESGKRFLIPYNDPRGLVIDIPVGSRSIVRDIGLKWKVSVGNGGDCRIKLGVFLEHPDGTTVAIPSSYSSYSGETHFGNHGRDGFDNPDLLVFHKKESEGAWKLKAIAVYDPDNANCSARDGTYLTDYRLTLAFGKLNGVSSVRP